MPLFSACAISPFYALIAWSSAGQISHVQAPVDLLAICGTVIFAVGELSNAYHHVLLRRLRKEGETGYKIPRGGCFAYAAAPHYFFELVGWFGFAVVTLHPLHFAVFVGMASYLYDRARKQAEWNEAKIKAYPAKERGYLVPWPIGLLGPRPLPF